MKEKTQIGNHPLLGKLPFFSPWSMAVKSKVVTIDVTFMMLLVLQLLQWFELKPKETMPRSSCGQTPAFFSQASEDAMRMHVDDSDHCLRAPIQLLGGIRNVPWIARVFRCKWKCVYIYYKYIYIYICIYIYYIYNIIIIIGFTHTHAHSLTHRHIYIYICIYSIYLYAKVVWCI